MQTRVDNLINLQPVMNGGIVKSPDEKYLLGLIVQPLDPKDKDKYPALSKRGDKQNDFRTISIMTNRKLRKQGGASSGAPPGRGRTPKAVLVFVSPSVFLCLGCHPSH